MVLVHCCCSTGDKAVHRSSFRTRSTRSREWAAPHHQYVHFTDTNSASTYLFLAAGRLHKLLHSIDARFYFCYIQYIAAAAAEESYSERALRLLGCIGIASQNRRTPHYITLRVDPRDASRARLVCPGGTVSCDRECAAALESHPTGVPALNSCQQ